MPGDPRAEAAVTPGDIHRRLRKLRARAARGYDVDADKMDLVSTFDPVETTKEVAARSKEGR